jgi:hypothetical protein
MGVAAQRQIMAVTRVGTVLAWLILAGCTGSNDAGTRVETLASWAATAGMLTEAWSTGAVPRAYSLRALGRVREALDERGRRLHDLPAELRGRVGAALQRLDQVTLEVSQAVSRGEREGLDDARRRLQAEHRALRAAADRLRGHS